MKYSLNQYFSGPNLSLESKATQSDALVRKTSINLDVQIATKSLDSIERDSIRFVRITQLEPESTEEQTILVIVVYEKNSFHTLAMVECVYKDNTDPLTNACKLKSEIDLKILITKEAHLSYSFYSPKYDKTDN